MNNTKPLPEEQAMKSNKVARIIVATDLFRHLSDDNKKAIIELMKTIQSK